ncbi:MAG TPA: hypothetical protein VFE65_05565 [Pseudonocardia sp.]|nr:hypothetical protein [Pseudonocardia sp.]
MAASIVIRGEHREFVELQVTGREAESLIFSVDVRVGGFSGWSASDMTIDDLARFRDDLRSLCESWQGHANLGCPGFDLVVSAQQIKAQPTGPALPRLLLHLSGTLTDEFHNTLEFSLNLIQEALVDTLGAVDHLLNGL